MPNYTDANGREWQIADWPGDSYKAFVINRAYANSEFFVADGQVYFICFWCKNRVHSSGVQGDHVATQQMGRSGDPMLEALFEEAENDGDWNLVLSCSECNGGSRNKAKRMTRADYRKDRDAQAPKAI